jgi:hypothetical protein
LLVHADPNSSSGNMNSGTVLRPKRDMRASDATV